MSLSGPCGGPEDSWHGEVIAKEKRAIEDCWSHNDTKGKTQWELLAICAG